VFNIGPQELLVILLVALVIVGPQRLPELSRTIGRGLREFRKAQDEVKKTIRIGLDETEPTTPARTRSPQAAEPSAAPDAPGPQEDGGTTSADEAADVARTLGRGLAEIRRARREIQRTFRVDLTDTPSTPSSRPATTSPPPVAPAPPPPEPAGPTAPQAVPSIPEPEPGSAEPGAPA
jgi:Tat protein translocase TatB subunit